MKDIDSRAAWKLIPAGPYLWSLIGGRRVAQCRAASAKLTPAICRMRRPSRTLEIDFVAAPPHNPKPAQEENLFDHRILVESSSEIIAIKVWHRGSEFTARDIFDLAMVAEREPQALSEISSILRDRRAVVLERMVRHDSILRQTFAELATLEYLRSFDECVEIVTDTFERA